MAVNSFNAQNPPVNTKGDVFTFSTIPTRLGVGANDTVLTADSTTATGLKWAPLATGFAGCRAYSNSAQSIANSSNVAINLAAETYDTDGYHDNSTNNTRLTIPNGKAGYYLIIAKISWYSNATGIRQTKILKNGSSELEATSITPSAVSSLISLTAGIHYLAVGDYVEMLGRQTSGGALNTDTGQEATALMIGLLGE